jgi:F-type H+-transporting ATPase subunit delta
MAEYKVSSRYAESFIRMAVEKNILEKVSDDVSLILSVIEESREFKLMLESPVIKTELKLSVFKEIFEKRVNADSMNFLKFILEKERENLLPDIIRKFLELKDEELGIANVKIFTAFDFDESHKKRVGDILKNYLNKKVRLNFEIDKSIIGGFIARVGDRVFDASLKHQLELLKKQFLKEGTVLN